MSGFSSDNCIATPFTEMVISGMVGKHSDLGKMSSIRCFNFRGMSLVKTDWNWVLTMFAFSTVAVLLIPLDLRQLISLLSVFFV